MIYISKYDDLKSTYTSVLMLLSSTKKYRKDSFLYFNYLDVDIQA